MGKRYRDLRGIIRAQLQTLQPFNLLEDLLPRVSIPVDPHAAVIEKQLRILRREVSDAAKEMDIETVCDGKRNVIPIATEDDIDQAITARTRQLAGRGRKFMALQEQQKAMRAARPRRHHPKALPADQLTLADLAATEHPDLAERIFVQKRQMASVVALHARDNTAALQVFMPMLAADPESLESFEVACRAFFKKHYGWDVTIPAAMFSEGVIQPGDLYAMWLQLAPALRHLTRKPDMKREA